MAKILLEQVGGDIKSFLEGREQMAVNPEVKTSTVFNNERSLQLALAQYLKESDNYDDVIMEYLIPKEIIAKKLVPQEPISDEKIAFHYCLLNVI